MEKDIKDLIDYISKSNFIEFELEKDGLKIKLVKKGAKVVAQTLPAAEASAENKPAEKERSTPEDGSVATEIVVPREGLVDVKSPIVGTFYRSPNPSAPPFADVGAVVKKGQVLCIVEAMKLMNEIESEIAGEVVEVLVPNAHPVEYGQVLFRIKPAE